MDDSTGTTPLGSVIISKENSFDVKSGIGKQIISVNSRSSRRYIVLTSLTLPSKLLRIKSSGVISSAKMSLSISSSIELSCTTLSK